MLRQKNTKKLVLNIIIEVIFTFILVLLLVFVREKSIGYLYDVQTISYQVSSLEKDLATENLTSYDKQEVQNTINNMDSLLTKGMILIKVVLPISLFLLSFLFYFIIWKTTSGVKFLRFFYSTIIPLISFLFFCYFVLNYIAYRFYFSSESSLIWFVVSLIFLIISYYISLFFLSNKKSFMDSLIIAKNRIKDVLIYFLLNLVTSLIYFVLVFWIFFLTYVDAPIIWPSVLLLMIIFLINLQRMHLFNKISKY